MPHLEFFVVSKSVSVDQTTNQTSIFEILEEVRASAFPVSIDECVALTLWRALANDAADADYQATLQIRVTGMQVLSFSTNFRIPANVRRHRVAQRIKGLPVQEGDLEFELLLNGQHAARHVVSVVRAAPVDIPAGQQVEVGRAS